MTLSKSTALIASLLALAACGGGDSGSGIFGWLTQEEPVEMLNDVEFAVFQDERPLVASVETLVIERLPGGIIVRATGLPPLQGWYDAQLVREVGAAAGSGVLVYSFRARPPETPTRVSTQQSRELTAGTYLSDIEVAGISSIRVLAANNARTVDR